MMKINEQEATGSATCAFDVVAYHDTDYKGTNTVIVNFRVRM
jgi:hypothetical protein